MRAPWREALNVTPNEAARHGLELNRDGQRRTAFELLSYPDIGIADVARIWPRFGELEPAIAEQLEIDAKYAVYLDRQAADVEAYRRDEALALRRRLDYGDTAGLSNEVRQKLQAPRPRTIGHAGRLDGDDAGGADAAGGPCPAGAPQARSRRRMSAVGRGARLGRALDLSADRERALALTACFT